MGCWVLYTATKSCGHVAQHATTHHVLLLCASSHAQTRDADCRVGAMPGPGVTIIGVGPRGPPILSTMNRRASAIETRANQLRLNSKQLFAKCNSCSKSQWKLGGAETARAFSAFPSEFSE